MKIQIEDIIINPKRRALRDVTELAKSIHEIGLLNPIIITQDYHLIAGLHRLEACRILGMETIEVTIVELDDLRAELAEIDENLQRNNLTVLEQGQVLIRRKQIYEALYPETKHGASGRRGSGDGEYISKSENISFSENTANTIGQTERSVQYKVQIAENIAPEIQEEIKDTEIAGNQTVLLELARLKPEQQKNVIEQTRNGSVKTLQKAIDKQQKQQKQERRKEVIQALPDKVFNVIYADPPWQYNNTGVDGAANHHYSTMPLKEICELPQQINLQIDKNAVLFLWVTNPFLQDAFEVVKAWEFEYKTNIVWVKTNLKKPGAGFYVRGRHELLFICTRGSFTPLDPNVSPPIGSVLSADVLDHSRKPIEVYDIIERLYPQCRYIELFARNQRTNWSSWGNETE